MVVTAICATVAVFIVTSMLVSLAICRGVRRKEGRAPTLEENRTIGLFSLVLSILAAALTLGAFAFWNGW